MEHEAQSGNQAEIGDRVIFTYTGQILDGQVIHTTTTRLWVDLFGISATAITERRHAMVIPVIGSDPEFPPQ